MISLSDYFEKPHTPAQSVAAGNLLNRVNALGNEAAALGVFAWRVDEDTHTMISGRNGGDGDGGFRTPASPTGGPDSSHRILKPDEGAGVDPFDPGDRLDKWLDGFEDGRGGNSILEKHGLYREHPDDTPGWCHLTTRAPHSGKRTFKP